MSRFIDNMSILAIEDILISKVSMLFRSSNVLEMKDEDLSLLAGETQESSQERRRLEVKQETLNTGLRGLKGLQKRRNVINETKRDQVGPRDSDNVAATTPSTPEEASIATNSAEGAAPRAVISVKHIPSPRMRAIPRLQRPPTPYSGVMSTLERPPTPYTRGMASQTPSAEPVSDSDTDDD